MGRACRNCARGIALSEAMKPYCQTRGIARPLCDSRTTRYTTVPVFRSRKSNGNGSYLQKLLLRGENSVINFIVHTVMCQRCVILKSKALRQPKLKCLVGLIISINICARIFKSVNRQHQMSKLEHMFYAYN